jgi:hypothetical protein
LCVQIFYNLKSLPSVIVTVIEKLVEETIAHLSTSKPAGPAAMDLQVLLKDFPELLFNNNSHPNPHITNAHRKALGQNIHQLTFTLASIGSVATTPAGNASVIVNYPSASSGSGASALDSHTTKLRIAVKEVAHMWMQVIQEQYLQVYCLQQVMHKKVDPTNKLRFSTLLAQLVQPILLHQQRAIGVFTKEPTSTLTHLCNCELIPLFCIKFADALKESLKQKVEQFPLGCVRLYPAVRGALVTSLAFIPELAKRAREHDDSAVGGAGAGGGGGMAQYRFHSPCSGAVRGDVDDHYDDDDDDDDDLCASDLFGVQTFHNVQSRLRLIDDGRNAAPMALPSGAAVAINGNSSASAVAETQSAGTALLYVEPTPLLGGLSGLRDLYMEGVYTRLRAPIHQMFPEMAGYNAAVPSKRDLNIYFQAIVAEYSAVLQESQVFISPSVVSDAATGGFTRRGFGASTAAASGGIISDAPVRVNDETTLLYNLNIVVLKSIYYYCSKVQHLVVYNQVSTAGVHAAAAATSKGGVAGGKSSGPVDIYKVQPQVQSTSAGPNTVVGFQKHASVEHNSLLIKLLLQTITNLEALYETVGRATASTGGSSVSTNNSTGFTKALTNSQPIIRHGIERFVRVVKDFAVAELIEPLINSVSYYIRNVILMPLLSQYDKPVGSGGANVDDSTSPAIDVLTKQLPELLSTYICNGNIDPCSTSVTQIVAVREIVLRTVSAFITIAALSRRRREQGAVTGSDSNEVFERQCINDCIAVDLLMTSHCSQWKHAVVQSQATAAEKTGGVSAKTTIDVSGGDNGGKDSARGLLYKYNEVALEFM